MIDIKLVNILYDDNSVPKQAILWLVLSMLMPIIRRIVAADSWHAAYPGRCDYALDAGL